MPKKTIEKLIDRMGHKHTRLRSKLIRYSRQTLMSEADTQRFDTAMEKVNQLGVRIIRWREELRGLEEDGLEAQKAVNIFTTELESK